MIWSELRDSMGLTIGIWPPFRVFYWACVAYGAIFFFTKLADRVTFKSRQAHWGALAVLAIPTAVFSWNVLRYLLGDYFVDHIESQIASVAWLSVTGRPIYHDLEAAERYSVPYGPGIYLIPGLIMKALGAGLKTVKLGSALAALAMPPLLYLTALRAGAKQAYAALVAAVGVIAMLVFQHYSFWIRAEPMLLFVTAGALCTAHIRDRKRALVSTGLMLGLAGTLKLTSPFYLLPAGAVLFQRFGLRDFAVVSAAGAAISFLPYALPWVSLKNYFAWAKIAADGHHFDGLLSSVCWVWLQFFGIPFALLLAAQKDHRKFLKANWAYLVGVFVATFMAYKGGSIVGGGAYHLLPLVPIYCHAWVVLTRDGVRPGFRWAVAAVSLAFAFALLARATLDQTLVMKKMREQAAWTPVADDLKRYLATAETRDVAVGYGEYYDVPYFRPLAVFAGGPYLIDSGALMGMVWAKNKTPPATYQAFRSCKPRIWLIQKDRVPFQFWSLYDGWEPIFEEEIRRAFQESYRKVGSTEYFDVWKCARE